MKTSIEFAPENIRRNYLNRRYGNASMAAGYLAALDFCKSVHYDLDEYAPVFGVIAERIKATGDFATFRAFVNAHADELRLEQDCERHWKAMRKWAEGPDAAAVIARNRAAYEADQIEQAINERANQIFNERNNEARDRALAAARMEFTK